MPIRACPQCFRATPKHLEASSKDACVNYYRCEGCGHVWNVPKDDPGGVPHAVTPPVRERVG